MDSGPPSWFGVWIAIVVVVGIAGFAVRITIARSLARRTGVDEDAATAAAVFGTGALTSMYLDAHRTDGSTDGSERHEPGPVVADLPVNFRHES